ncbi:MAG: hypothetical protein MI807_01550 [Verrucomicrobiales bacterium]|nr:hypothetical protein [Verrucomicrobiales bacterium]
MRFYCYIAPLLLAVSILPTGTVAQDAGGAADTSIADAAEAATAVKLDISRRQLRTFLTDKEALEAYGTEDEQQAVLHGAFMIGSPGARYVAIWDPTAARLVGVLDLQAPRETPEIAETEEEEGGKTAPPTPYVLIARGLPPFQKSSGAFGMPEYFGFRVVDGRPEFLYTHGSLRSEESIWLEDEGNTLKQKFSIRDAKSDIKIAVPSEWKDRITPSVGDWEDSTLKVSKEDTEEIELAFVLTAAEPAAEKEE